MSEALVRDHFTRFVYPFAFAEETFAGFSPASAGVWDELGDRHRKRLAEFLLPHVVSFLAPQDAEARDCRSFSLKNLNHNAFRYLSLGRGSLILGTHHLEPGTSAIRRHYAFQFTFETVELYLFQPGTGFLVLETELKQSDIRRTRGSGDAEEVDRERRLKNQLTAEDLIQFNYAMRSLVGGRQPIRPCKRDDSREGAGPPEGTEGAKSGPSDLPLSKYGMRDVVDGLMASTGFSVKGTEVPLTHLIGFTYLRALPYDESRIMEDLFRLRRFFRDSYPPSDEHLQIEGNPEIVRTFANITFGLSLEGGAVLALDTGHKFVEEFQSRVRNRYFVGFLLALQQQFTLRWLAHEVGTVQGRLHGDATDNKERRKIRTLRNRILHFVLRCRFTQISGITMHNLVYERWRDVLRIEPLLGELKGEVDELDELLRREEADDEEERQWQTNRRLDFLLPIALLTGAFGMNISELDNSFSVKSVLFWVTAAIGILLWAGLFFMGKRPRRRRKQKPASGVE